MQILLLATALRIVAKPVSYNYVMTNVFCNTYRMKIGFLSVPFGDDCYLMENVIKYFRVPPGAAGEKNVMMLLQHLLQTWGGEWWQKMPKIATSALGNSTILLLLTL